MAALAEVRTLSRHHSVTRGRKPIDLVHLAKQSLGDPGLEEEILRMFDQLMTTYMKRVRADAVIGDATMSLHSLKGASAGVGATAIADLAKIAEDDLGENGQLDAERVADLGVAVEEARAFIAELLDY